MFKATILVSGLTLAVLSTPGFAKDKVTNDNKPMMNKELRWDTDKDGFISKQEWMKNQEEKFTKMDANADGKIGPEEMKAHYDGMREKMMDRMKERREKMHMSDDKMPDMKMDDKPEPK